MSSSFEAFAIELSVEVEVDEWQMAVAIKDADAPRRGVREKSLVTRHVALCNGTPKIRERWRRRAKAGCRPLGPLDAFSE